MKILICGPRDFSPSFKQIDHSIKEMLGEFSRGGSRPKIIIHGGATGVDSCAHEWARSRGISVDPYPVSDEEWKRLGKSAGPIRNQRMLKEGRPDFVLAIMDRKTRGTSSMINLSKKAGVRGFTVNFTNPSGLVVFSAF